jgi:hypothetical protein
LLLDRRPFKEQLKSVVLTGFRDALSIVLIVGLTAYRSLRFKCSEKCSHPLMKHLKYFGADIEAINE